MSPSGPRVAVLLPSLLGLALAACSDPEAGGPIEFARRYKPAVPTDLQPMESAERFGYQRRGASERREPPFTWATPDAWESLPSSEFRVVNLRVREHPDAECYVTVLRGGGGRQAENLNRWRGQMGQTPLTAEEIGGLGQVRMLGGLATRIDVDGTFGGGMGDGGARDDYRLIGALLEVGEHAISIKMIGPRAVLESEAGRFDEFVASLAWRTAEAEPVGAGVDLSLAWDAPAGWGAGRTSDMRLATFLPEGAEDTECVVFRFKRPSGGDELSNVQRWYGQMSQQLPADGLESLAQVEVLGRPSRLVDIAGPYGGMGGEAQADHRMLAVYSEVPGWVVCVKMTGPAETMQSQRENFLAFCRSLRQP